MNRLAAELDDLGGADITGALEDLPVRSFVIDADGVVRWQNAASRTAIGDWAGRKWFELVSEKHTEELEGVVRRMFCSGDPAEVTFDVREADGKMARREVSAAPLREGGAVVGLFGVSVPVGQIADELVLSPTTVRNHIAHALANLGVHTRVQAVIAAARAGLIRLPTADKPADPG